MIKLFKGAKKERISTGVDIGSSSIKAVKLRFLADAVELAGFAVEPSEIDPVGALKRIKEKLGVDTANLSVSGPATVIRYVSFPKMNQAELTQALKFEAQKHIPFPVSDVNLDGFILKDNLPGSKMLVLLAAAKKDLIQQRIKSATDAGFRVSTVDIDALALINAFNFNYPKTSSESKAVALLNIGASISNLNILEDASVRLSRDIHFGGNNFTQKIADIFEIDFKAAELLKLKAPDEANANKINAAVDSVLTNLATEIRTSFDFYESQSALSVSKIFLSGGAVGAVSLKQMLGNILGMEIESWDPLKNISISAQADAEKLKLISNQFTVAVGLGLR